MRLFIFKSCYIYEHDYNGRAAKSTFIYTCNAHTCCDDFLKIHQQYIFTLSVVRLNSVTSKKKKLSVILNIQNLFKFQDERLKFADDKSLSEHLKLPIQRINDYQLLLKVSHE
jgi:hypothetical protein